MREIDLTVIADIHCPTSRTYLAYLKEAGFIPHKVILTHFVGQNNRWTKIMKLLGRRLSNAIIHHLREKNIFFEESVEKYFDTMQDQWPIKINYKNNFNYNLYASNVVKIAAYNYDDTYLHEILKKQKVKTFLYTNGGRVPDVLLREKGIRILHIHPGVVPCVRGSDGLLWSIIERGRPGVSCFYMDAGIDTGNVIDIMEFPPLSLPISANIERDEEEHLYRALLIAYDPHMRAALLCDIIKKYSGTELASLPTIAQPYKKNDNFLWMHPRLRLKVFKEKICAK